MEGDKTQRDNSFNIDISGLTQYWKIVEKLSKNIEPDPVEWNTLFNSKGYKSIQREFSRQFFKKHYRIAFMPSKENEAQTSNRFIKHYLRVNEKRKEIDRWVNQFQTNLHGIELAQMKAKKWLPREVEKKGTIAFAVFDYDARGYDTIVLDPLFAMSLGSEIYGMLSHEMFHFYSRELMVYDENLVTGIDTDIVWLIKQLNEEGIADHIYVLNYSGREEDISKAPLTIREINALIKNIQHGNTSGNVTIRSVLPHSGHPTGYYMANVILLGLGKKILLSTVGNPFLFINLYQKAANTQGKTTFSKDVINYINRIYLNVKTNK